MTSEQTKAFLDAVKAADIKTFEFDTDLCTHLYNDAEHAIVKVNYDLNCAVAIRANDYGGSVKRYTHDVQVVLADFSDIHEARTAGTADQIQKFLKAIGNIELTDEELRILVKIDNGNYDIIPETGDYNNTFHYLSKKQVSELDEKQRQEYEASKEKYEKEKREYIPVNQAASITLN